MREKVRLFCHKYEKPLQFLMAAVLFLYPLRHAAYGVDLMDGGYNFGNFAFLNSGALDPMWLFSTYLATGIGHLIRFLPLGRTLFGMNLYTGLLVSSMAAGSYFFLIKKGTLPSGIVFLGELTAVSLCWAPTTMLYSYLTYGFLLAAMFCLFLGLTKERNSWLLLAGALLGTNVGVRFPNLTETVLILTVWGYGFIKRRKISYVARQTLYCVAGYGAALGLFLGYIDLRYGLDAYVSGILRLFQMTSAAPDYAPSSMLLSTVSDYFLLPVTYILKRFLLIPAAGCALCLIFPTKFLRLKRLLIVAGTVILMLWLPKLGFYTEDTSSYYSMRYPAILAMLAATLLAFWELFRPGNDEKCRLLAMLTLTALFLNPLGGNNGMYSNFNNLFLTAPFFFWSLLDFCRQYRHPPWFSFQCLFCAVSFFFAVQSLRFGADFVYEEADGGRQMDTKIREIPSLSGMHTNAAKAGALKELYQYLQTERLAGKKCILYGNIPGVAAYLDLTPAMNTWPDLRSYQYETMSEDLEEIVRNSSGDPDFIVILESEYAACQQGAQSADLMIPEETERRKFYLLCDFLEQYEYKVFYANDKFTLYHR